MPFAVLTVRSSNVNPAQFELDVQPQSAAGYRHEWFIELCRGAGERGPNRLSKVLDGMEAAGWSLQNVTSTWGGKDTGFDEQRDLYVFKK